MERNKLESSDVTESKVDDVDVVADAGAVGGGVVVAKDVDAREDADGDLGDEGHEVVGDAVGVLADEAAGVGADGVEVAEEDDGGVAVGDADVAEDLLDEELGLAVGVGGVERRVLGDGDVLGGAVDARRRREDEAAHAVRAHRGEEHERAGDVVRVVLERLRDALADGLEARKVDDGVDRGLEVEHAAQARGVAQVHLVEREARAAPERRAEAGERRRAVRRLCVARERADLRDAVERQPRAVAQVVDHDDAVPARQQLHHRVAPNVPRATRHQNRLVRVHPCP